MTHDVKNPLGAADGFAQLLELELSGTLLPEQAKLVAGVRRGIHGALAMITDLLDLSLAESGGLAVHREPVDLAVVAAQALEDHRGAAEAAGHVLVWEGHAPVSIHTDPVRVRGVLGNLLTNAISTRPLRAESPSGSKRMRAVAGRAPADGPRFTSGTPAPAFRPRQGRASSVNFTGCIPPSRRAGTAWASPSAA